MSPFLSWSIAITLGAYGMAIAMLLARVLRGPKAQDRIVALDMIYSIGMLMALAIGLLHASSAFFEAALLIALFGFVGTSAMAKFLLRGEVIE